MSPLTGPVTAPASVMDRFSPTGRLAALLVLAVAIAFARGPLGLALAFSLALGVFVASRLSARVLWHRLAHVEGFLLVLLVMLPLTMPGAPLATIGPVMVSQEGLARAGVIAIKVNAAVILLTGLLGALEPTRLPAALAGLGLPRRLVALFGYALRFVGLMSEEADRLKDALKARAFTPRLDRRTLATYGHLGALIVLRAHDRAARIDEAMRCRGFGGRLPARVGTPWRSADAGLMATAGTAALVLGWASW